MTVLSRTLLRCVLLLALLVFSEKNDAQTAQMTSTTHKRGRFFAYWGWNRAWYTKSNLHFTGKGYDFTLDEVVAKDRQTPFAWNIYFHPTKITIPQTNLRIGYFLNEHYHLSFGADHMKYVVQQNQTIKITGQISGSNTPFDGVYEASDLVLTGDFLKYEHTDGLNYINLELGRNDAVLLLPRLRASVGLTEGIGIGALYPRSDVTLLNNARNDKYHIAGYGISAKAGLNLTLFKYFFLQSELKAGFINLPNVRTTASKTDKASQRFGFLQHNYTFGFNFFLFK